NRLSIKGFGVKIAAAFSMKLNYFRTRVLVLTFFAFSSVAASQTEDAPVKKPANTPQAEAIIQKAIQFLGGEKYLNVKTQIAKGKYSILRDGGVASFQTFSDVIVYPDKERTDFKGGGTKSIQTNVGNSGWVYDGDQELVKEQNEKQIEGYKRGIRTSLDYL